MENEGDNSFTRFTNKLTQKLRLLREKSSESITVSPVVSECDSFRKNLEILENSFQSQSQLSCCNSKSTFFTRRLSHLTCWRTKEEQIKLELTNFLKIYFDFAYFLCLSPFRLISEGSSGDSGSGYGYEFSVETWWPQKVACAGVSFLSLLWFVRDLRLSAPKDPKNPSLHFRLLLKIVGLLMKSITLKRFWMNKEEFRNVLNFIVAEGNSLPVKPLKILKNPLIRCLCILYTGMGITNWICGLGLGSYSDSVSTDDHIHNWSHIWWWTSMVNASNYNLFLKPLPANATATTISSLETFLAIPATVGFLQMHILANYCDFLVLMSALTLWTSAYSFSLNLFRGGDKFTFNLSKTEIICRQSDEKEWIKVYRQYKALTRLAHLINVAIGSNITFFLMEAIFYYATRLDEVFFKETTHDACEVVRFIFFFCNTTAILLFSADVCNQMSTLKAWLSEEEGRVKAAGSNLVVLLNDLDGHTVGIRGNNIFPITYSLVANMVGTTVTYFVICVQAGNYAGGIMGTDNFCFSRNVSNGH